LRLSAAGLGESGSSFILRSREPHTVSCKSVDCQALTPLTSLNKTITFKGVLLQLDNSAAGYFLGTNQSGFVTIEPPP
jgi:hypothetical protein